jgi:two-component system, sensor histidine kinase and response regulator
MRVESEEGKGSTFHFQVRLGMGLAKAAGVLSSIYASGVVTPLAGKRVLVVDDNRTLRHTMDRLLTGWRMEATTVSDSAEAWDAIQAADRTGRPFDLVLVDTQMPAIDGFRLALQFMEIPDLAQRVILLIHATDTQNKLEDLRVHSSTPCLIKPVTPGELFQTLLKALGEPGVTVSASPSSVPQQGSRRLRILLAEDNLVNQRLAVKLLERQKHSVLVAGNGKEALEAFRREKFDIVLMDLQMPVMGGFEATIAIRQVEGTTGSHTPIVALTAHAFKEDQERCMASGMDGYMSKPIRAQELIETVERMAAQAWSLAGKTA